MTKRICISGGAGFIGHRLVDLVLRETDWQVTCIDRLDSAGNLGRLGRLESFRQASEQARVRIVFHDLRAPIQNSVQRELGGPYDYCAHLAAGSHVDRSVRDPAGFVLDNCLGTAHILDWAREHCGRLLYFGTDEVLGSAGPGESHDESAPFNPLNPYAASKAAGEVLIPAYANTYGMDLVITRSANAYGPGQDTEKFIPHCVSRILAGDVIDIHARWQQDPTGTALVLEPSSRLYTHVDDVCRATLEVLQRGARVQSHDPLSGRYHISGGEETSNARVASLIAEHLGQPLHYRLVTDPPGRPKPDQRYGIDASKLRRELAWEPRIAFEEGLRQTVESIRASVQ